MWMSFLIADKLAILLCHLGERRRDKRIRYFVQKHKAEIEEAREKDTITLDKMFEGVERVEDFSEAFRKL